VLVPDLDRLPRGLRPAWRAVADALRGQQPAPVVADAVEKALARTLRHSGGLQWLADLADAVVACHSQGSLRPMEVVVANLERSRATGVGGAFLDAAWSLAALDDAAGGAQADLDGLVARGLERMIEKLCIGPLEPDLVPAVFSSTTDLWTYIEQCVAEVQLDGLARQLTRSGCTGNVRAPRTRLSKVGTKGLLYEPVG
jgi:hypothetical protein